MSYLALSDRHQSRGKTAGEALDALAAQLTDDEKATLVIVQNFRPDRFFDVAQMSRLAELMGRWREARDRGDTLSSEDQAELEALVEAELDASAARTAAIADEFDR